MDKKEALVLITSELKRQRANRNRKALDVFFSGTHLGVSAGISALADGTYWVATSSNNIPTNPVNYLYITGGVVILTAAAFAIGARKATTLERENIAALKPIKYELKNGFNRLDKFHISEYDKALQYIYSSNNKDQYEE